MGELWERVREHFSMEEDDGDVASVELHLNGLEPLEMRAVFALLQERGADWGTSSAWDEREQREVELRTVDNPARKLLDGSWSVLNASATGIRVGGEELPDLGVWANPDELNFYWWRDHPWTEARVVALFDLIGEIRGLAPRSSLEHYGDRATHDLLVPLAEHLGIPPPPEPEEEEEVDLVVAARLFLQGALWGGALGALAGVAWGRRRRRR